MFAIDSYFDGVGQATEQIEVLYQFKRSIGRGTDLMIAFVIFFSFSFQNCVHSL